MAKSKKKRRKKKIEKTVPVAPIVQIKKFAKGFGIAFGLIFLISIPSIIFHFVTDKYFPVPDESSLWKSVGYIGTIIIGVVSLAAAFFRIGYKTREEKPSQKFYIAVYASLTAGVCVLLFGCFLMYGGIFSEEAMVTYFLNLFFIFILGISYLFSRGSIDTWLRHRGKSKTYIRKHKKGIKNYWLYEELHKECNLGIMYYLNKWFVIFYPITFALMFTLGCFKPVTYITAILFTSLVLMMIVTVIFAGKVDCDDFYGDSSSDFTANFLHILAFRIIVPCYALLIIAVEWVIVFGINPLDVIMDFIGDF